MIRSLILCAMLALFTSCSMLSPEQRESLRDSVQAEYQAGAITAAQRDAAIEAIDNDEPIDWETWGFVGINLALALVGGPLIVRKQRGAPTQKVGLPASKVHAEAH